MKRNILILILVTSLSGNIYSHDYEVPVLPDAEPMHQGKFNPTWQSLSQYEVPEWFRNAKFGIWAH